MKHERGKERGTILNTLVKMSLPRIEKGKKIQLSMKRKIQNEEKRVAKFQAIYRLMCPEE